MSSYEALFLSSAELLCYCTRLNVTCRYTCLFPTTHLAHTLTQPAATLTPARTSGTVSAGHNVRVPGVWIYLVISVSPPFLWNPSPHLIKSRRQPRPRPSPSPSSVLFLLPSPVQRLALTIPLLFPFRFIYSPSPYSLISLRPLR